MGASGIMDGYGLLIVPGFGVVGVERGVLVGRGVLVIAGVLVAAGVGECDAFVAAMAAATSVCSCDGGTVAGLVQAVNRSTDNTRRIAVVFIFLLLGKRGFADVHK
jgi:uncharacterized membrane protein